MQFELEEILTVIDKVKDTELASFEYQDADTRIKIKGPKQAVVYTEEKPVKAKAPKAAQQQEQQPAAEDENSTYITSPMVGTFYTAPEEGAEPFVQKGDSITRGQVVGIIEAMKLMNEVEADCEGVIEEVLVENEQMVEFGQPLFRIR